MSSSSLSVDSVRWNSLPPPKPPGSADGQDDLWNRFIELLTQMVTAQLQQQAPPPLPPPPASNDSSGSGSGGGGGGGGVQGCCKCGDGGNGGGDTAPPIQPQTQPQQIAPPTQGQDSGQGTQPGEVSGPTTSTSPDPTNQIDTVNPMSNTQTDSTGGAPRNYDAIKQAYFANGNADLVNGVHYHEGADHVRVIDSMRDGIHKHWDKVDPTVQDFFSSTAPDDFLRSVGAKPENLTPQDKYWTFEVAKMGVETGGTMDPLASTDPGHHTANVFGGLSLFSRDNYLGGEAMAAKHLAPLYGTTADYLAGELAAHGMGGQETDAFNKVIDPEWSAVIDSGGLGFALDGGAASYGEGMDGKTMESALKAFMAGDMSYPEQISHMSDTLSKHAWVLNPPEYQSVVQITPPAGEVTQQ